MFYDVLPTVFNFFEYFYLECFWFSIVKELKTYLVAALVHDACKLTKTLAYQNIQAPE